MILQYNSLKNPRNIQLKLTMLYLQTKKADSFCTLHDLETYLDGKVICLFINDMRYIKNDRTFNEISVP